METGVTDQRDLNEYIHNVVGTHFGDADLNGIFNSSDLIKVFTANLYETGQRATWGQGDWNCDGKFDSSDLVEAFKDGRLFGERHDREFNGKRTICSSG